MKGFALLVVVLAWGCLFFAPKSTGSRVAQLVVFGLLGTLFTLAGGFAYWWDSSMQPSKKSALVLVCGVLTLLSQSGSLLRAVFEGEGGTEWPERPRKRR